MTDSIKEIDSIIRYKWYKDLAEDLIRMYNCENYAKELDEKCKQYLFDLRCRWHKILETGDKPVHNIDHAVVTMEYIQYIYENMKPEIAGEMETGDRNTKGQK